MPKERPIRPRPWLVNWPSPHDLRLVRHIQRKPETYEHSKYDEHRVNDANAVTDSPRCLVRATAGEFVFSFKRASRPLGSADYCCCSTATAFGFRPRRIGRPASPSALSTDAIFRSNASRSILSSLNTSRSLSCVLMNHGIHRNSKSSH